MEVASGRGKSELGVGGEGQGRGKGVSAGEGKEGAPSLDVGLPPDRARSIKRAEED